MKKQFSLVLLLSFVSAQASDPIETEQPAVPVITDSSVILSPIETAAEQPAPEAVPAPAPVEPAPEVIPGTVAPIVPAETATPTVPAPASSPSSLPTEDDINKVLALVNAHQKQSSVIKSLHDLVSIDDQAGVNLPNEASVRSLLNLLELHKREADLIASLRASIASLQAALGKWDSDVATLLTRKQAAKQKAARRGVDYEKVKEIVKRESR